MRTKFPYGKIDFQKYWDIYMQREDAITSLPSEVELEELAIKAIGKEHIALVPLPEDEAAREGDTATLSTVSSLPKFNKPKVTVSLGRGLYNKELETMAVGKKVGDSFTLTIQGETVAVTILALQRKSAPAPTDEMVVAMGAKDGRNQPITTVEGYIRFIKEQNIEMKLANINYYIMEEILKDFPITKYDEEDIRVLGELEKDVFIKMFLETEGIDLRKEVPQSWKDEGMHTLEDFIARRCEWYKMKIQQCLVYQNLLNLPDEGATDPLDHYEVLSELTLKMWDKIKEKLEEK